MNKKVISSRQQLEDMIDRIDEYVYRNRFSFFPKLNENLKRSEAWLNLVSCHLCSDIESAMRFVTVYSENDLPRRAIIILLLEQGWKIRNFRLDGNTSIRINLEGEGKLSLQAKKLESILKEG